MRFLKEIVLDNRPKGQTLVSALEQDRESSLDKAEAIEIEIDKMVKAILAALIVGIY